MVVGRAAVKMVKVGWFLMLFGLVTTGCSKSESENKQVDDSIEVTKQSNLFVEGCPVAGQSMLKQATHPDFSFEGINALSQAGDFLLANQYSAFAVTANDQQNTYYHYPGILVDAASVSNCQQTGGESFDELALMIARLNLLDPGASVIRAFHGETFEIINDGSDGQSAHLRVTGKDDRYWLLEYELITRYYLAREGRSDNFPINKPLSAPMNIQIVVDYILPPDSPNLQISYQIKNLSDQSNHRLTQMALIASGAGPRLTTFARWELDLTEIAGLELQSRMPYMSSPLQQDSFAFAMQSPDLFTTTHFAGIDALFDLSQLSRALAPTGQAGDTIVRSMVVAPVAGDEAQAVNQLVSENSSMVNYRSLNMQAKALDQQGDLIGPIKIELQAFNLRRYETFFQFFSDETGNIDRDLKLPGIEPYQSYRLIASAKGRKKLQLKIPAQSLLQGDWQQDLVFSEAASLQYQITNQNNQSMPFKLTLIDEAGLQQDHFLTEGSGELAIAPGEYQIIASRGFEYRYLNQLRQIDPGKNQLSIVLPQLLDTTGFMSYDAHVHSAPSPDSRVSLEDRIATVVAHGLDVVVSTDHEAVTDLAPTIQAMQMQQYVASVPGQEVTATRPEHTIAFPLPTQENQNARGNPVRWYQKDLAGIWQAEKDRGAEIRTLAHPKGDSNILTLIEWNRLTGKPDKQLIDFIGLESGQPWSWDFEAVELINGNYRVLNNPDDPKNTGLLDDWISFINFGHRITATGASDTHGLAGVGMPRNFFATDLQSTEDFQWSDLIQSIKQGKVVASTGAYIDVQLRSSEDDNNFPGSSLGETVTAVGGVVELKVKVQALPQIPVNKVLVLANCQMVAYANIAQPTGAVVKLDTIMAFKIKPEKDANIVVLALGDNIELPGLISFDSKMADKKIVRAITNPIYIDQDGNGQYDAPGGHVCQYDVS